MNLNTARVFVRNLAAAEDFYANKLRLPLRAGSAALGYFVFAPGDAQLVVELVPPDAPEDEQALVGRFAGLSFEVGSVEEKYLELVAQGVAFTGLPERQPWGGVVATFQDLDGNQLQIAEYQKAGKHPG